MNVPKLCGGDIELCNFFTGGVESETGTGTLAAHALLKEVDGLPLEPRALPVFCDCEDCRAGREAESGLDAAAIRPAAYYPAVGNSGFNPQDWGRKFLPANGGCVYIDLDHLEVCLPEVRSARDHVAAWHAMLRIARSAQAAANANFDAGHKIHVLVNNSDGHGNSYGSHLDFLITRRAWNNIFNRRLHYCLYLAAYQVSSIVFTGQGKVSAENGAPPCAFQISQRADFIEVLTGVQTTFNRPVVNSRDEPLCGNWWSSGESTAQTMARLHVIFYDSTLCHVACLLKVGVMQIILAMIEAECVDPKLILNDPVAAVMRWSHDPLLSARLPLADGKHLTAIELQLLFLEQARAFVDAGGCERIVPDAKGIVEIWADTLAKLEAGEFAALAPRIDWVLKHSILERAMQQRPGLTWESPEIKHLDHLYSALEDGLYWAYARNGFVERLVNDEEIERFVHEPPEDTRAWTRSKLLRLAEPDEVESVDWDSIRFRFGGAWPRRRTVSLANPLEFTKAASRIPETATTIQEALDAMGHPSVPARQPVAPPRRVRDFPAIPTKLNTTTGP